MNIIYLVLIIFISLSIVLYLKNVKYDESFTNSTTKNKPGNNGSVSGETYCKGAWDGWSSDKCINMKNDTSGEIIDCSIAPVSVADIKMGSGSWTAKCEVQTNKLKSGNNGGVNGNTFCKGAWEEWSSDTCYSMSNTEQGKIIDCYQIPGSGNWTAVCSPPGEQKLKSGNNGSVNGNTYCKGAYQGWSSDKCINMSDTIQGKNIDCNQVPGNGNWTATCTVPEPQKLKPGNNGSVSGNTYCKGSWNGWSSDFNSTKTCNNMSDTNQGKVLDCEQVPGIGSGNWIATCSPPPPQKLKPGLDNENKDGDEVSGLTYCRDSYAGWSAEKCISMTEENQGQVTDCNQIPNSGSWTVTCGPDETVNENAAIDRSVELKYGKKCIKNAYKGLNPKMDNFYKYDPNSEKLEMHFNNPNIESCDIIENTVTNAVLSKQAFSEEQKIKSLKHKLNKIQSINEFRKLDIKYNKPYFLQNLYGEGSVLSIGCQSILNGNKVNTYKDFNNVDSYPKQNIDKSYIILKPLDESYNEFNVKLTDTFTILFANNNPLLSSNPDNTSCKNRGGYTLISAGNSTVPKDQIPQWRLEMSTTTGGAVKIIGEPEENATVAYLNTCSKSNDCGNGIYLNVNTCLRGSKDANSNSSDWKFIDPVKCADFIAFIPSNNNGFCSMSEPCDEINGNNGKCFGINQLDTDGGCNGYCYTLGKKYYIGSMGGCIGDKGCGNIQFGEFEDNLCNGQKQFWNFSSANRYNPNVGKLPEEKCKQLCRKDQNCDAYLIDPSNNICMFYKFNDGNSANYKCNKAFNNGQFYGEIKKNKLKKSISVPVGKYPQLNDVIKTDFNNRWNLWNCEDACNCGSPDIYSGCGTNYPCCTNKTGAGIFK